MRRSVVAAGIVVVLIGAAYLAGYLPERRISVALADEADALRTRLAAAEGNLRTGELLGQAIILKEAAMRQNYGQALDLSSSFFDAVMAEADRAQAGARRDVLNDILARRDAVTAALAKADPAVVDTLYGIERRLRGTLGYPLPPEAPASAA